MPGYRVEDDLAVLVMDHLAPRSGRDLRSRERVEGVFIDVVASRTVLVGERLKCLDRVEDIADVWAFGDAVNVGHGALGIVEAEAADGRSGEVRLTTRG